MDVSDGQVVEAFGVLAKALGETQDGVDANLAQPRRGPHAATVGEVLGNGDERVLAAAETEQWRVGAFGEVGAATGAVQAADALAAA
jgi:hypothetical protein